MAKYEIEYAQFTKVIVEAENEEEANDLAAIMDGEEIAEHDTHEYSIWNVRKIDFAGDSRGDGMQGVIRQINYNVIQHFIYQLFSLLPEGTGILNAGTYAISPMVMRRGHSA